MSQTRALFDSLSVKTNLSSDQLAIAVDALLACEAAVTACATGMLAEHDAGHLSAAVVRDMDCAGWPRPPGGC